MEITRRTLLEMLAAAPLAVTGGRCKHPYPKPQIPELAGPVKPLRPILAPLQRAGAVSALSPVVDAHAHFFNASDVPVRGFLEECLGHRAHPLARKFLKAAARIAERLADRAPTAADELARLRLMVSETPESLSAEAVKERVDDRVDSERRAAARRLAEAIRGSEFERLYRRHKPAPSGQLAPDTGNAISDREVIAVLDESERPTPAGVLAPVTTPDVAIADGMLGFLHYMLSYRWVNVAAYKKAFTDGPNAFGIDRVLGSLVDFDYWLDCPPRSAHQDQITLHASLRELHGDYLFPVVAYNPWTDINQRQAGLDRVKDAFDRLKFVAVKIYPPTGFVPFGNVAAYSGTSKRHPDLKKLDDTLINFFDTCASLGIPVIAHTNRSNGRDDAHDEFGGPAGWSALLRRYSGKKETPTIDFGHFGGETSKNWTCDFATLMSQYPDMALYGDLGYWDQLTCESLDRTCDDVRRRLEQAMKTRIGPTQTVASRTMFGTDWLMLSQVKGWPNYPARLLASLKTILSDEDIARVFGQNARSCFTRV